MLMLCCGNAYLKYLQSCYDDISGDDMAKCILIVYTAFDGAQATSVYCA